MNDIRENLKMVIEEKGLIQNVVAKKANLSASKLSAILHKNRKLDVDEFFAICKALDIKPDEVQNYQAS